VGVVDLTRVERYFAHAVVLLIAVTVSGYASIDRSLSAATKLRLGVVNAQGLTLGQGGNVDGVALGRSSTIIKPIAVPTSAAIQHTPTVHVVRDGEDLSSIATQYNVTMDSIRWSNPALTNTDRITTGQQLVIPPVVGVVVAAKPGDSAAALAAAYHVDVQQVIDFNYLRRPELLDEGQLLVIPGGQGPQLFPRRVSTEAPHIGPFPNGRFYYGYCTWYVASRRNVPWTGNAWEWFGNAKAMGFATGQEPQPGAIMVTWESWVGHVAYVESVNADGSFTVSEMNYKGWGVIDTRTLKSTKDVPLIGFVY
jgi:LysM repeat protein